MISLSAVLLGLINIAIVVGVLLLVGLIIKWVLGLLGFSLPPLADRIYLGIVALIALYMIVSLLLGNALPFRFAY